MMQWDQVKLNISPPCVLEAPGVVTDNHSTLFSHIFGNNSELRNSGFGQASNEL